MPDPEIRKRPRKKRKGSKKELDQVEVKRVSFLEQHERRVIIILCILAGLRVLLFNAGFPFFNNVDEGAHFDMICRYSHGHIPKNLEHYTRESSDRIIWSFTMEYLGAPGLTPRNVPPPLWRSTKEDKARTYEGCLPYMKMKTNHESTQLPLYYAVMALWFKLGKLLTLNGGHLLYWLKIIDVPIYALLVWVSHLFVKRFYARDVFLRFGVPLLLVVFPQDLFYSINSDVFTPLLFSLSLYGLLVIYFSESKSYAYHLLTGLAVAATSLVKFSNMPVLLVLGILVAMRAWKGWKSGNLRAEAPKLAVLCLVAVVPIALWLARNHFVLGDITGNAAKVTRLHWTYKPFAAIWSHPVFTAAGFSYFWAELMKTFWRGEFVWFEVPVASPGMDNLYVWSSSAFLIVSVIALWVSRKKHSAEERVAGAMGLCLFAVSVGMLAFLSTLFDFDGCRYPSRLHPFFTSGRLMFGAIVPFAILYLRGFDIILSRIGLARARWALLALLVVAVLLSEIEVSQCAFHSQYNWYRMF